MIHFTRCDAEEGAVRSYTVKNGRFLVSRWSKHHGSARNAWSVRDTLTGSLTRHWTRNEAREAVALLVTPSNLKVDRFLILPREHASDDLEDVVLYDRVTGRWWKRQSASLGATLEKTFTGDLAQG